MITNTAQLLELAKDTSDLGRTKLVGQTAEQLLSQARDFTQAELGLFGDIFSKLYQFTDAETKEKLATAIALADWAPISLVRAIALDNADIAGPVLSFSPVIEDELLTEVVKNGSKAHQVRVAERPHIGANVTNALVDGNHVEVIAALSKNLTAKISQDDILKAIEIAKSDPKILDNFVSRNDISNEIIELASKLGSSLALEITKHQNNHAKINELQVETITPVEPEPKPKTIRQFNQLIKVINPKDLFRELTSGQKSIFLKQVAGYIGVENHEIIRLLRKQQIESFALLARSIGFEANQVQTLVRELDFGGPLWRDEFNKTVVSLWLKYPSEAALEQLREMLS